MKSGSSQAEPPDMRSPHAELHPTPHPRFPFSLSRPAPTSFLARLQSGGMGHPNLRHLFAKAESAGIPIPRPAPSSPPPGTAQTRDPEDRYRAAKGLPGMGFPNLQHAPPRPSLESPTCLPLATGLSADTAPRWICRHGFPQPPTRQGPAASPPSHSHTHTHTHTHDTLRHGTTRHGTTRHVFVFWVSRHDTTQHVTTRHVFVFWVSRQTNTNQSS